MKVKYVKKEATKFKYKKIKINFPIIYLMNDYTNKFTVINLSF